MSLRVRKIRKKVIKKVLKEDLEKYRCMALELGATDAKIIKADQVILDERVQMKCTYPKCDFYGTNAQCPPYTGDIEQTRRVLKAYQYAIMFMLKVPSKNVAGPNVTKRRLAVPVQRKIAEIVLKIEGTAFYDGYYFALGFASGPCKIIWCPNVNCAALNPGSACRFPLKARSSMEGVGMDVYAMATRAGWDIYPCGKSTSPKDIPHGTELGLILIF